MAYSKQQIKYAKELILEGIANGKSLTKVIKQNKGTIPTRVIVYQWFNKSHDDYDEAFLNAYTHAREQSADSDADMIIDIALKVLKGKIDSQAARVAIDAIKWTAGIKKPQVYGKRIIQEHEGKVTNVNVEVTKEEAIKVNKWLEENF